MCVCVGFGGRLTANRLVCHSFATCSLPVNYRGWIGKLANWKIGKSHTHTYSQIAGDGDHSTRQTARIHSFRSQSRLGVRLTLSNFALTVRVYFLRLNIQISLAVRFNVRLCDSELTWPNVSTRRVSTNLVVLIYYQLLNYLILPTKSSQSNQLESLNVIRFWFAQRSWCSQSTIEYCFCYLKGSYGFFFRKEKFSGRFLEA